LIRRVSAAGVPVISGAAVLGIFPENRILYATGDAAREITARYIIAATGARERFLPFPGWTLPGVIATGAAQVMMKSASVRPAESMLIAGAGPLLPVLAAETLKNGGRVRAVLDGASFSENIALFRALPHQSGKLAEGARLLFRLAIEGVPYRSRVRVVAARGEDRLEAVETVRTDRSGRPVKGSARVYETECLAVGNGFTPNIELLLQAGCRSEFSPSRGGFVATVNEALMTSVENVYAAGEVTGIGGAKKSFIEGELAALSILENTGRMTPEYQNRRKYLVRSRKREIRFGALINRLCRLPMGWAASLPDDTVICRCEDVRMGDLRRWIAMGAGTFPSLKRVSRVSMGNCQGRICGPLVCDILSAAGLPQTAFQPVSARAPVKAVRLGALTVEPHGNPPL
jgi:NADPH-dependent 2,4-dienoyl-CoA reductase/sulfur reductase-like enzyme